MRYSLLGALLYCAACASTPPQSRAAFDAIMGDGWRGSLIYRDYSPPYGDVTLPVEAAVSPAADGLVLALHYPTEPHADETSTISISAEAVDGQPIVTQSAMNGVSTLVTRGRCEDDNRPATCETTYTLSNTAFAWRKMVTIDGGPTLRRHEYNLARER